MTVKLDYPLMNKVTADKQTLNALILIFYDAAKVDKETYPSLAESLEESAHQIYEALNAEGFYDRLKEDRND